MVYPLIRRLVVAGACPGVSGKDTEHQIAPNSCSICVSV